MVKRILFFCVGMVLLGFVLLQVDWAQFGILWQSFPLEWAFLTWIVYTLLNVFRALRYRVLLGEPTAPARELFFIGVYHNFLVRLLPFKLGEATYVILLKQRLHYSYGQGVSSLVGSRLFELLFIVTVLVAVVVGGGNLVGADSSILLLVSFFCVLVGGAFFYWGGRILRAMVWHLSSFLPFRLVQKAESFAEELDLLREPKRFWGGVAWSMGTYSASFMTNFILLWGLGIEITPINAIIAVSIGMFATAFPFNVSGFGAVELGWAFALTTLASYSLSEATTIGLFLNTFQVLCASILGLVGWLYLNKDFVVKP